MRLINCSNWNSFFASVSSSTNHDKGLQFELLTLSILKCLPVYKSTLENVWLLREGLPSNIKKKLNIPQSDEGIDIIAQTYSGEFWAIQCKFKASKEPPTMRELSTFNNLAHTHCKNISMAILFHTGEKGVRKKHLMGDKYAEVGLEFWLGLTHQDWEKLSETSKSKKSKPEIRKPREHQKNSIKQAKKHFLNDGESRGRLIMPCGTGKSLTAFWIANELKAGSIIVAVPSLNLIKQSLEDWTAEFIAQNENPRPEWQVICSDDSTSKIEDEFVNDVYSLGIPTTTSIQEITKFLKKKTTSRKIIFTTYQSSDRLAAASRRAKFTFDLAILDEAHKTVGVKSKSFATLLSDKNISVKKRMFMTATERVLKGTNDDVLSMDDESVYGKRFYQLTFKDAIHSSPQIISDYKILTIAVTNSQIQELIQKNKLLSDKKNKLEEQDAQSLAAAIALRQATKKYGIKHAISFHRSIKAAESFSNLNEQLNSSKIDKVKLSSYHISSQKSAGQRSQLLDDFKNEQLALMTNARCLTEGVNVPTIDCVLFADPKQSVVDIVQAAGRALRVSPGKKYGYIMMPLIVPDKMELEEFSETTPFKQVAKIISALSTQDERIVEELRLIDTGRKFKNSRIEIGGELPIGLNLNFAEFSSHILVKYWSRIAVTNSRRFELAKDYVRKLNLKNINEWRNYCVSGEKPQDIPTHPDRAYKYQGWLNMGDWLGTGSFKPQLIYFKPYDEAKIFVHKLKLKNQKQWQIYAYSNNRPKDIPSDPARVYSKEKKWKGFGDWLGTNTVSDRLKIFLPFKQARMFSRSLKLKTWKEWKEFTKKKEFPKNIPVNPNHVYKKIGWVSMGDWLGTGRVANQNKKFVNHNKAKKILKQLKISNREAWRRFLKSGIRLNQIPYSPDVYYKNSGWKGWSDFLGKK